MADPQATTQNLVSWPDIDTVLLDMDGTLLDKHFDDYFWEQFVPENYALQNNITVQEARQALLVKYKSCEGTLDWTDLDFWSRELGLDIPALKVQVDGLIQVHPYVVEFLDYCRQLGKEVVLVTNAHGKTLDIKMDKTALGGHFDRIVCSQKVGMAKEDPAFWPALRAIIPYDPVRTMLCDDTEAVLVAAATYGLGALIYVARPSSRAPVRRSKRFPSIVYFKELL
jgi:FMN phosphatase YigB (HAD superfamily)